MSKNPLVMLLWFVMELVSLAAMAYGAWAFHPILGILVPVLAAAAWGTFRVPNDPNAPLVRVPGTLRLCIEISFFSLAAFWLYYANQYTLLLAFSGLVLLMYALSYDRLFWLVKQ